jgi:integrase
MPGKQAKILSKDNLQDLLTYAAYTRNPARNQVIVLLSAKAGLRAAEIAQLTWDMVIDPNGEISSTLELQDHAAKKRSGRLIPLHSQLRGSRAAKSAKASALRCRPCGDWTDPQLIS